MTAGCDHLLRVYEVVFEPVQRYQRDKSEQLALVVTEAMHCDLIAYKFKQQRAGTLPEVEQHLRYIEF